MLLVARILAAFLGVGLIAGEIIRSWGVSRPLYTVLDDFLVSGFLLAAAFLGGRARGGALLTGAFGFSSGMLLSSVFLHVQTLEQPDPGNIPKRLLAALIALAFAGSVLGLSLSLRVALRDERT